MKKLLAMMLGVALLSHTGLLLAQTNLKVEQLQERWSEVNYLLQGKAQIEAFSSLLEQAHRVTKLQPDNAEAWTWSGIIQSSYAGAKGGLGALSLAKAAKADFESAMDIDGDVLDGSAYTSLGVLYLNVPGWPLGFGDDELGVELLKKGLKQSPDGIDSNYFYAEYLFKEKEYDSAQRHLRTALAARPREGRQIADDGRREEIRRLLEAIDEKR